VQSESKTELVMLQRRHVSVVAEYVGSSQAAEIHELAKRFVFM